MNVLFQVLAAVLFILLERGRHVRGPWRRKEWRNVLVQGFWLVITVALVLSGPVVALVFLWRLLGLPGIGQ